MSAYPAIFLGDIASECVRPLALIPTDSPEGAQVRALHIVCGEDLTSDEHDYWLIQVGKLSTGSFQGLIAPIALTGGLSANVQRTLPFLDPVLVSRGDILAVLLSPRGAPPPVAGLFAVVEWGLFSTRRFARA